MPRLDSAGVVASTVAPVVDVAVVVSEVDLAPNARLEKIVDLVSEDDQRAQVEKAGDLEAHVVLRVRVPCKERPQVLLGHDLFGRRSPHELHLLLYVHFCSVLPAYII